MTNAGMYGDYGAMRVAKAKIDESRETLGNQLETFKSRANLDRAIPSLSSNSTPVAAPSPLGPDIDQLETLLVPRQGMLML